MKARHYLLLAFSIVLITIAMNFPASFVWSMAQDQVDTGTLVVTEVGGSVWKPWATLQAADLPASQVELYPALLPLLGARFSSPVQISGLGHTLNADLSLTSDRVSISNLAGSLASSYMNSSLQHYGLNLGGNFTLTDIDLAAEQRQLQQVSGRINWTGGIVTYQAAGNITSYRLPAMAGNLSMAEGAAKLTVAQGEGELLSINLRPDGWVKIEVLGRLIRIAQIDWPGNYQDQEVVFSFEEKLFPGLTI